MLTCIITFNPQNSEMDTIISIILQIRKLRLRESNLA